MHFRVIYGIIKEKSIRKYQFIPKVGARMPHLTLLETIRFLETVSGAHFSVCNLGGLPPEILQLPTEHLIHAAPFCSVAKSTARGFDRCLHCKARANRKALAGQPFEGPCAFGLYEFACPVCRNGQVLGVVYAGNLIPEDPRSLLLRHRTCIRTGVSEARLTAAAAQCVSLGDRSEQMRVAVRLLADEVLLHLEEPTPVPESTVRHPAVQQLLRAARVRYGQPLSLEQLARQQHIDAKYLGRLFLQQTGKPFHGYLNELRLNHAAELLRHTPMTVLAVALECGFQNISYFNRRFRQHYHCTPLQYRSVAQKNSGVFPGDDCKSPRPAL